MSTARGIVKGVGERRSLFRSYPREDASLVSRRLCFLFRLKTHVNLVCKAFATRDATRMDQISENSPGSTG